MSEVHQEWHLPLRSARGADLRGEVEAFLESYAHAFLKGDGRAVSCHWSVPSLIITDEEVKPVSSLEQVRAFFDRCNLEYRARGIEATHAEIITLDTPTDRVAMVAVRWPLLDAEGEEQGSELATYVLRKDAFGEYKIQSMVMQGEDYRPH